MQIQVLISSETIICIGIEYLIMEKIPYIKKKIPYIKKKIQGAEFGTLKHGHER